LKTVLRPKNAGDFLLHGRYKSRQREVNVTYQLRKIRITIADNGFIAILEQMALPSMAQIKTDRVSGLENAA
jgi:hypothetical protein